ncbi:MAG TPA: beta-galactosidase trimerization domain-containing protein [Tepidisphaeraceae bacterium]
MLAQLRHQFDFVHEDGIWEKYELLILPDSMRISQKLAGRLKKYLSRGGKLLATGLSGLSEDANQLLLPELPIVLHGMSPYSVSYVRWQRGSAHGDTDHAMYDRSARVTAARTSQSLTKVVEPYFERSWDHFSSHYQTPPDKPSRYSASVCCKQTGFIAYPIFSSFAQHANRPCRWLLQDTLNYLLPDPLLRTDGPTGLEATVLQQRNRQIVHLLYYSPERRGKSLDLIEDIIPLHNTTISLKLEKKPSRVYLAPNQKPLDFTFTNHRAIVQVPEINGHATVVFEV